VTSPGLKRKGAHAPNQDQPPCADNFPELNTHVDRPCLARARAWDLLGKRGLDRFWLGTGIRSRVCRGRPNSTADLGRLAEPSNRAVGADTHHGQRMVCQLRHCARPEKVPRWPYTSLAPDEGQIPVPESSPRPCPATDLSQFWKVENGRAEGRTAILLRPGPWRAPSFPPLT